MQLMVCLLGDSRKSPAPSLGRPNETEGSSALPSHAARPGRGLCNKALPALRLCPIWMLPLGLWTKRAFYRKVFKTPQSCRHRQFSDFRALPARQTTYVLQHLIWWQLYTKGALDLLWCAWHGENLSERACKALASRRDQEERWRGGGPLRS